MDNIQHPQPPAILPTPAPAQIALALVILKTKPANLTVDEYLTQLSHHVKPGLAPQTTAYLDSQSFWKEAYEKREKEVTQLQDRIFDLESIPNSTANKEQLQWDKLNGAKRKSDAQSPERKANTQSKRTKLGDSANDDTGSIANTHRPGDGIEEEIKSIMRHQYALHDKMSREPAESLANHVHCLTASITNAVKATIQCPEHDEDRPPLTYSDIDSCAEGFPAYYKSTLLGMERGSNIDDCSASRTHILRLFYDLLAHIDNVARCEVMSSEKHTDEISKIPKLNWRLTKSTKTASEMKRKAHERKLSELTSMVRHIFDGLDNKLESHCQLLEWLIYVLFDHVASNLAIVVFGTTKCESGQNMLPLPQDFKLASAEDQAQGMKIARMKGWCLVAALKAALVVVNVETKDSTAAEMLSSLQNRLQATLLHAVFGDDTDSLKQALEQNSAAKECVDVDLHEVMTDQTWYIAQVWEILGWDMLTRDGSWMKDVKAVKAKIVREIMQSRERAV